MWFSYIGYMSPEVLNGDAGNVVDAEQADLWSMGCIFYEILNKKKVIREEEHGRELRLIR